MTRKLVTIRRVTNILPIEGADSIELAIIDGWQCVVKKGEFQIGGFGLYFEIDCFLDHTKPQFEFLAPRAVKWNDKVGARIKSMKLRGALSQGLLLPITVFPELYYIVPDFIKGDDNSVRDALYVIRPAGQSLDEDLMSVLLDTECPDAVEEICGWDFAEQIGVLKWEKIVEAGGQSRGSYPSFLRKTDQERIQNLSSVWTTHINEYFQVTTKLDGSSLQAYSVNPDSPYFTRPDGVTEDYFMRGVCSRNADLAETLGNAFWETAKEYNLFGFLQYLMGMLGGNAYSVQGEMIAPNIQDNYERVTKREFYVFDIFDIDRQEYLNPHTVHNMTTAFGIDHAPIVHSSIRLGELANSTAELLLIAENTPSLNRPDAEGIVLKTLKHGDDFSFKAVSNKYLISTGN